MVVVQVIDENLSKGQTFIHCPSKVTVARIVNETKKINTFLTKMNLLQLILYAIKVEYLRHTQLFI